MTRDHGGNLDAAMARFGGTGADWIDLSTGINPRAYPVPAIPDRAWTALPTAADMNSLIEAARRAYDTRAEIVPLAGAQAAIQTVPRLAPEGPVRILAPTYNEHAAAFRTAGRTPEAVASLDALQGSAVAIVVNPNNPDGRSHMPEALRALSREVGLLIIDESFADPEPQLSIARDLPENAIVMRSFGKFYGLAGLRLGFALAATRFAEALRAEAGPWPVSGPAIAIGTMALSDTAWQAETTARLARDAARLDGLAARTGWSVVGGTTLFRTYETEDAGAAQTRLAQHHIWSRIFPYSDHWIRLGLPDGETAWDRLESALT